MTEILERFDKPITIIGGGEFVPKIFRESLQKAPDLIAVDGGLNHLTVDLHSPKWIIGDLDSAKNTQLWANKGARIRRIPEQQSTDLEKCLYSIEAPLYLANGFLGHRVDHLLASCSALVKMKDKNVILLGKRDLIVHVNEQMVLNLEVGTRLSLFPLQDVLGVHSLGLKYSVEEVVFSPGSMIGTSNETIASRIEIAFDGSGMLLILPIECLYSVLNLFEVDLEPNIQ